MYISLINSRDKSVNLLFTCETVIMFEGVRGMAVSFYYHASFPVLDDAEVLSLSAIIQIISSLLCSNELNNNHLVLHLTEGKRKKEIGDRGEGPSVAEGHLAEG